MNAIINAFKRLFGIKSQSNYHDLRVVFYKEAAIHGSHGQIVVSHRKEGLVDRPVNFAFVGVSTAPELTPGVLQHIFNEAFVAGYVPRCIIGGLVDNVPHQPGVRLDMPETDVPAVWRSGKTFSTGGLVDRPSINYSIFDQPHAGVNVPSSLLRNHPDRPAAFDEVGHQSGGFERAVVDAAGTVATH